jgi:hypothetical protein
MEFPAQEPHITASSQPGQVGLPGSKSLSMDSRDAVLRKLNLRTNTRTATRTVETWLQPVYSSTGSAGLRTDEAISLNNHNIFVDSFDSTLLDRSYGGVLPGQPYPAGNQNSGMGFYNVAPYNFWQRIFLPIPIPCREAMPIFTEMPTQMAGLWRQSLGQEISRVNFTTITMSRCPPLISKMECVFSGPIKTTKTLTGGTSASHAQYIVSSISLSGQKVLTFDFGKTGANLIQQEIC